MRDPNIRKDRHKSGRGARRAPFLGTVPPPSSQAACWEIHREIRPGAVEFAIYLDGARIGAERGAEELRELLVGARLRSEDANRVIATLGRSPVVWVEVRPAEGTPCRKPAPESRY